MAAIRKMVNLFGVTIAHDISSADDAFEVAENEIRATFETLHDKLDKRRDELLTQLQAFKKSHLEHCKKLDTGINDIKTAIREMQEFEAKINLNVAKFCQKRAIDELNAKIQCLEKNFSSPKYKLKLNISKFEDYLSLMGHIISCSQLPHRDYTLMKEPISTFGKYGTGPGEFDKYLHNIFYDVYNDRVFISGTNKRLTVWTMDGEYLQDIGADIATFTPFGIALYEDCMFASGYGSNLIYKLSSKDFKLINTSEGIIEPKLPDFSIPTGIAICNNELFVAERVNKRLSVYDFNFNLIRILKITVDTAILDFKIKDDIIYILQHSTNIIYLLSLAGRIIDKFPTRINDNTALLISPFYFCVDNWNNILITDVEQNILRIVSLDGKVLVNVNTKDEWGHILPRGIATTRDGRVLIVFGGEHKPCFAVL